MSDLSNTENVGTRHCIDCKGMVGIELFKTFINKNKVSYRTRCIKHYREYNAQTRQTSRGNRTDEKKKADQDANRICKAEWRSTTAGILAEARKNADMRHVEYETDDEDDFVLKVEGACYYCGGQACSLDRVDPLGNYNAANTVGSCSPDNFGKHRYSPAAYISQAKEVTRHRHLVHVPGKWATGYFINGVEAPEVKEDGLEWEER
jgi:hypothetical protein